MPHIREHRRSNQGPAVTRLEAFAERVTREVLEAVRFPPALMFEGSPPFEAARAMLEREVREFIAKAADQYVEAAMTEVYCDEPAHPERG